MKIKLGEQLKEFRLRDGRTQEDLAEALGVTPQAVSRWEKSVCYPDMEVIPAIANYFGVSIDELFGYQNEREKKIDALADKILSMNRMNNGKDINMEECIHLAREGLLEFPNNETLLFCLASVLLNAGYVRYGEHHLTDEDGYDILDTERHKTYAEWKEAISLFEKFLSTAEDGERKQEAIIFLLRLYLNTGVSEKAAMLAEKAPSLSGSREFLRISTVDGKERATAYAQALLQTADACAHLMLSGVMVNKSQMTPEQAVQSIRGAIEIYRLICTDENYGSYHEEIAYIHLYLAAHLWRAGDHDGAFKALDTALFHAKKAETILEADSISYTAPLTCLVKTTREPLSDAKIAASLPEDFPFWHVPDLSTVKKEMRADPRWDAWVEKTQK